MDDDTAQLIEDCETREERLTDWERGFIDSIKAQIVGGRRLSEKQTDRLNEIWERATAKG
jgi:hypothetical protein